MFLFWSKFLHPKLHRASCCFVFLYQTLMKKHLLVQDLDTSVVTGFLFKVKHYFGCQKKSHCLVKVSIHRPRRHQQKTSLYARMLIYNHLCCSDDTHWLICTCDHCLWSRLGRIFRASWLHLHLDFMPSDIPCDYRKSGNVSVKGVLKRNEKQRSS